MLLSPSLLIIGGFLIAPLCIVLVYSFLTPGTFGGVIWEATFDTYIQFLFERDFLDESEPAATAPKRRRQIYLKHWSEKWGAAYLTPHPSLMID